MSELGKKIKQVWVSVWGEEGGRGKEKKRKRKIKNSDRVSGARRVHLWLAKVIKVAMTKIWIPAWKVPMWSK